MKEIKLTKNKVALVDDNDFEYLNQFMWQAVKHKNRYTYYAMANIEGKTTYMHRLVLGLTDTDVLGDHKDHDGLNNQRSNLRVSDYSQSNCNMSSHKNSSSKYKGVHWDRITSKWRACIQKNGVAKKLGRFVNEDDAALAYNKAAIEWHGEFANLNKVA